MKKYPNISNLASTAKKLNTFTIARCSLLFASLSFASLGIVLLSFNVLAKANVTNHVTSIKKIIMSSLLLFLSCGLFLFQPTVLKSKKLFSCPGINDPKTDLMADSKIDHKVAMTDLATNNMTS